MSTSSAHDQGESSNGSHEPGDANDFGGQRYQLWLVLATALLVLPFANKALHIDDPLFVWTAEQILIAPSDFYGFDVNWYGIVEPMYEIQKNPPLVSYYLALIIAVAGDSEIALHLGMFLPTVALVIGIAALARRFGTSALRAGLLAVTTPVFVLSATSLMSDVAMLALWCWALLFFVRGFETDRVVHFVVSGLLIGLCVLTKYFGLALIPLAFAYGALRARGGGRWLLSLVIGLLIVAAFDLYTHTRYGLHPLLDVMEYATYDDGARKLPVALRAATGVFFLGGCAIGTLLLAPWLWSLRSLSGVVFTTGAIAALCVAAFEDRQLEFGIHMQQAVFAVAGLQLAALALRDVAEERTPEAWMLALWLFGVFCFAAFTNWTTNGRSILPAIPAVSILVARALAKRGTAGALTIGAAMGVAALLSVLVASADFRLANSARVAARMLGQEGSSGKGELYFQGSWGFQHYMQQAGVAKMELGQTAFVPGDRIVMPANNTNLVRIPPARTRAIAVEEVAGSGWISILSRNRSAGFYASVWGSLPFSFGTPEIERYGLYEFTSAWEPVGRGGSRARTRDAAKP